MINSDIFFSIPPNQLPSITLANSVTIDLPYVHFGRMPVEYILYVILDGEMYLTEDQTEYTLVPGDFILLDPSRYHFGRKGSRCFYYYIHFTLSDIGEISYALEEYMHILSRQRIQCTASSCETSSPDAPILLPKYFHPSERAFARLEHHAKNILLSFHNPIEFHIQTASCQLLNLLIAMHQHLSDLAIGKSQRAGHSLSLEIIAYLKIYYPEKITGERLEKHFYKNFDYMNRIFKKAIGKTIFQWLNDYRISEAQKLLQSNYYTQKQIAENTGFSNEFYFSRVFKKLTGTTPSEYQRKYTH